VVDKDDELGDHLNFLVQGRIEASGLIVALSFGGFTILTLFENKQWVDSVSWWVLSIAYLVVLLGILFAFPQWATSIWKIEHVRKLLAREAKIFPPWYSESDKEKAME
jgi:putative exporter of polyketide antibiotics